MSSACGWEFYYEFCAARVIFFCADVTTVFQYYSLNDSKAETCAAVSS